MAGTNSQKELLTLIRDGSTEKSQGERRVVNLKSQVQQLQSELDSVNLEVEEAKRLKECTEQELKGYEVELAKEESSIQSLESWTYMMRDGISAVGSDLKALKNEEGASWDDFIRQVFDLDAKIRKFHQPVDSVMNEPFSSNTASQDVNMEHADTQGFEKATRYLEVKLAQIISETNKAEDEDRSEQILNTQEKKEVDDLKHRISLMEAVREGRDDLKVLAVQNSGLEHACTSLADKLQKSCICPRCQPEYTKMVGDFVLMHASAAD